MPVFTFGAAHVCPQCGLSLRNSYVELPHREAMVALFGIKWSHEYESPVLAGADSFNLKPIVPNAACACGGMGQKPWAPERTHTRVFLQLEDRCVILLDADGVVLERAGPFPTLDLAKAAYQEAEKRLLLLGGAGSTSTRVLDA